MRATAALVVAVALSYIFTGIMGYANTQLGKVMDNDMKQAVKDQNKKYISSGIGKQIVEIPIIGQLIFESFTFGGNLGSLVKDFFKNNPIDLSQFSLSFTGNIGAGTGINIPTGLGQLFANSVVKSFRDALSKNKLSVMDFINAMGFNGTITPGANLSNIGTMAAQAFIGGFKNSIQSLLPQGIGGLFVSSMLGTNPFSGILTSFNIVKTQITTGWTSLKSLLMAPIVGFINIFTGSLSTAYRLGITVYGYIRRGASGGIKVVTGALSTAYSLAVRVYNYVRAGATGAIRILTGSISSALGMVRNLYSTVRAGASGVISIVKKVTGGGPAGPSISQSMGSGPFDKLNLNYEAYQGTRHSPFVPGGLSGNCVDMSLGLLSLNGGRGSIIQGTWNGGPHVWYQDPSGRNWDPARKAIVGSWNPPARGPNETQNNTYHTVVVEMKDNTIYGEGDFTEKIKKIAENTFYNEMDINQATGH